jgi:hypothetical protein
MSERRAWTEDEVARLRAGRAMRPPTPYAELADEFDRSAAACEWKFAEISGRLRRPSRAGQDVRPRPEAAAAPAQRRCLTCGTGFRPEHRTNFVCGGCKGSLAWRCAP